MSAGTEIVDVVGFGESSRDQLCVVPHHPAPGEKLRLERIAMLGGGQVATAMVACARLGLRARYLGVVGADQGGRLTLAELEAEGVDTRGVRVVSGAASRRAVVLVDGQTGERTVLWQADPALALGPADVDLELLLAGRVVHLDGTWPEAACFCARRARAAGLLVSVDLDAVTPEVEELVALADLCIVPAPLALELGATAEPAAALRRLAERCRGLVALTLGSAGALTLAGDTVVHVPGFAVETVDTTGCGDVFHAAAIVAALEGRPPPELVRFANAAAALAARRLGALSACPTRAEVEALLGE